MLTIGLTGGIGSGKSAVSDRFAVLGIDIVDADVVAREVVEPGQPALQEIAVHFGDDILNREGGLDRAQLRKVVFKDPQERKWLESLLHPLIGMEIVAQLERANKPYAMLVSPLLFETAQAELTQRSLLVDVPVELQIERTMQRDNNSRAQVQAIIDSQMSRAERLRLADDVIVNDSDLAHLDREVEKLHTHYCTLAADGS